MYTGIHSSASYFPLFQQVSSFQSQNKNEPNPKSLVKLIMGNQQFQFFTYKSAVDGEDYNYHPDYNQETLW